MSRRLVLNLSPIQFDNAEVRVGILEYQSKEQLQALRAAYFATHIFRRTGKRLLCVPVVPEAPEIGGTFETIRLAEELYLCATLIRNALLNHRKRSRGHGAKCLPSRDEGTYHAGP